MPSIIFDRAVSYYDATRGYPPGVEEQVADAIVAAVGATNATHFLEMGIGTGRIALPLAMRGYRYTGIDLSQPMMDVLRKKLTALAADHPEAATPTIDLIVGDSTALPFDDAQFDVAITVHVLHLIPNWRDAVREAMRVVKPGGYYLNCGDDLIMTSPSIGIRDMWTDIVRDLGYDIDVERFATYKNAVSELEALGYHPEVLRTVSWQTEIAPRSMYNTIAQRLWSRTWNVPDDIFAASVERLRTTLELRYGDTLDTPETRTTQFIITRTRK